MTIMTMKTFVVRTICLGAVALCCACTARAQDTTAAPTATPTAGTMNLGEFSVSLSVRDIAASIAFYEKLGFVRIGGAPEQNWVIMRNGSATIGLFQGMFEGNLLTFNPADVRDIQRSLKREDVPILTEADESTEGPAHIVLKDPDGNVILLDQF